MAASESNRMMLIFDPAPARRLQESVDTMGSASVPLDAVKASMKALLRDYQEIFDEAWDDTGEATLSYVDLSLAIAVDGSVGLFGFKAGAEARGGITVRLEFTKASS
jgi:hypothetical protein